MFFDEKRKPLRVLVFSAHPDDETLGAGGTLARHAEFGDQIMACITTQAYTPDWNEEAISNARKQATTALETLGVAEIQFLGFPTVKLDTISNKEINDSFSQLVEHFDPQVIYSPSPTDLNNDHRVVAGAAAIASRPIPGSTRRTLLFFETLSSTEWGRIFLGSCFLPNIYIDISATISTKIAATRCYDAELREFPHPRSVEGIKTLARLRGMEVGLETAEAFSLSLHIS